MRLVGISTALAGLLGGCTVIFNSNNLPTIADATVDATVDAAPPAADARVFDVNPAGLSITAVDPTDLVEGTGDAGGRPAILIVTGANFDPHATINIVAGADPVPAGLAVGATTIADTFDTAAVPVTVPVIPTLADGAKLSLEVVVTNPGGTSQQMPITIDGLDELSASGAVAVSSLKPLYSQATFAAATHFTGASPAHVRVTAGIKIGAAVDASGAGTTAGPGGCGGGGASTPGGCTPGGGGGGGSNLKGVSGGGGGFGTAGSGGGGGSGAGTAGQPTGDDMLTQLDYAGTDMGNRGNGGGGGGGATLGLGTAGVGGGGGGTIELTAGGAVEIDANGAVLSTGGNATKGGGVGPGDGGAGSGGALLVRAGGGVTGPMASSAWLSAAAGGLASGAGGAAGVGRIRVDTPGGGVPSMATNPPAKQGPAWATGASGAALVVGTPNAMLPLVGEAGRSYGVFVGTGDVTAVTLNGTTMKSVPVTLVLGHNKVCAVADPTASTGNDVALDCIDVVYLPGAT